MSKVNTKKPRKRTHKFVDNSRVTKVVVMPKLGTRAYSERAKYGLPAIFEVDPEAWKRSDYMKAWRQAYEDARIKEFEVNEAISKELFKGAPAGFERQPYDGTYILEKVKTSTKKVNLV